MSIVQDFVACPQCGYAEADYLFDCRTRAKKTMCTRCGFNETWKLKYDEDGNHPSWAHEIIQGSGVLCYRPIGARAIACHTLKTETKQVEIVVGSLTEGAG